MDCPDCGHPNKPTAHFCTECNHWFPDPGASPSTTPAETVPEANGHPPVQAPRPAATPGDEPSKPPPPAPRPPAPGQGATPARPAAPTTPDSARRSTPNPVAKQVTPKESFTIRRETIAPADVVPVAESSPEPTGDSATVGDHGLFAKVDPLAHAVAPGTTVSWHVQVRNTGLIIEHVKIDVDGLPREWWSVDRDETRLDTKGEAVVQLNVTPPKDVLAIAGPRPFTVVVWSATEPALRVTLGARVLVEESSTISIEVSPEQVTARRRAPVLLTVNNDGNTAVRVRFGHSDPPTARLHVDDLEVQVAAGDAASVTGGFVAERYLWRGMPKRHTIEVSATAEGGARANTMVEMSQTAVLPPWFGKAAALAAVVMLLPLFMLGRNWWDNRPREVPSVVGMQEEAADAELKESGFEIEQPTTGQVSDRPVNEVLAQDPAAGERASPKDPVELSVSSGPEMVELPVGVDRPEPEVTSELAAMGLVVDRVAKPDDEVALGTVLAMSPDAGSEIAAGETVTLTVSSGAGQVAVPPVENLQEADAIAKLSAVVLNARPITREVEAALVGRVIEQSPTPGTMVDPGTEVQIVVGQAATTTTAQTAN